jgi:hypothetical protein
VKPGGRPVVLSGNQLTIPIYLPQVYRIEHPEHYKLHLACGYEDAEAPDGFVQPLDDFVEDRKYWGTWNSSPRKCNDFSRNFIFTLMEFYPQEDRWLFGGAYRVLGHQRKRNLF